jgi:predicted nucleotidyltransferase component of viral defense system
MAEPPTMLRADPDTFDALRDETAHVHALPAGVIEKDYWAMEVLRSATTEIAGAMDLVFKGGTSLSKAFGIIERFSEDIDLLIVTDLVNNPLKRLLRSIAVGCGSQGGMSGSGWY